MRSQEACGEVGSGRLDGAPVVVSPRASQTVRIAAMELARYLYLLTGRVSRVTPAMPAAGAAIALDNELCDGLGCGADARVEGEQGYRLTSLREGARRWTCIGSTTPAGCLYGVYGLLEKLGMGFYAGGETFPDGRAEAAVPEDLAERCRPAFRARGNMLHYNFLCGCTTWGAADYKFYFDQLARMRCNMLLMHWYDNEPGAACEVNGEYIAGGVTPNSLSRPWGALQSLRTSQFSFGSGRHFAEEVFSSPMAEDLPDLLTEIKRSEAAFAEATRYARQLAIGVAAGFEAPRGDPTDPRTADRFRVRVRQFLSRNPDISHFALWQHESGGCFGTPPPRSGGAAALYAEQREMFAYLGNARRVWEAIRFGRFAAIAAKTVSDLAPQLPTVIVGWGGEQWMRFADACLAYDRMLPPEVVFTCHDNIDASMGAGVSDPWGRLPPERERWAMPWVEGDIDDCMVRQPHVESLGKLAPDALRKGCQGLLTLQWRTRDVEEETGFAARYAWDPTLTPERFYRDLARRAFGADQEERMQQHLGCLQRLGARWSGVRGCAECSRMRWTGWEPHMPFELDRTAVAHLMEKAEQLRDALAACSRDDEDGESGAFHLRADADGKTVSTDPSRPGVAMARKAIADLCALQSEAHPERIREGLTPIEAAVYEGRHGLVEEGMSTAQYQAIDGFLIAIHHLRRNAGAEARGAVLREVREDLRTLRAEYVAAKRTARLERLDYLAATMDYVVHFDEAVKLLAKDEMVDRAIAAAEAGRRTGDPAAKETVAEAYRKVIGAGMREAVAAFTRKLTTRCDYGTLATINVKPLALYWETIGRMEELMPAAPPREVSARGRTGEVWISWEPGRGAAGQQLYRRGAAETAWQRVNRDVLSADCRMFVDRCGPSGRFLYAVSSVDREGWESPKSHAAEAVCGTQADPPAIRGCRPQGRVAEGEDLRVRVTAVSERGLSGVTLYHRRAAHGPWLSCPMMRGYRHAFAAVLSAEDLRPGMAEFFVEAVDEEGRTARWPQAADAGLPWTVVVAG